MKVGEEYFMILEGDELIHPSIVIYNLYDWNYFRENLQQKCMSPITIQMMCIMGETPLYVRWMNPAIGFNQ